MKLIVGLGNPGAKYQQTRHNVGFLVVDAFAKKVELESFTFNKYVSSEVSQNADWVLAKPQTFMNSSGEAVALLLKRYDIHTSEMVLIHDDLDIALGDYKISMAKGPKVHNGVNSVEKHLKTDQFLRVRVGVDNRSSENRLPGETYVLQDFTPEEMGILAGVIENIVVELMNDH